MHVRSCPYLIAAAALKHSYVIILEPEAHKLAFFIIASEKQGVLVAGMSGVRVGRQKYMSKRSNSLIFIINGTQEQEEPRQIELQIKWFKSISMCSLASANTNSQNCQKKLYCNLIRSGHVGLFLVCTPSNAEAATHCCQPPHHFMQKLKV